MGERYLDTVEVGGSIPPVPTICRSAAHTSGAEIVSCGATRRLLGFDGIFGSETALQLQEQAVVVQLLSGAPFLVDGRVPFFCS